MKKFVKLMICSVCLSVMLSACTTIPRPTCPSANDIPTCKIEQKGEQILANLVIEGRN